jgi:hypothetical protein
MNNTDLTKYYEADEWTKMTVKDEHAMQLYHKTYHPTRIEQKRTSQYTLIITWYSPNKNKITHTAIKFK